MIKINEMTLLYMYDDKNSHQKNIPLVRKSGFNILNADSPDTACALLQTKHVDLALIDYHTLDKSGLEPLRHLRQKDAQIPVIIAASHAGKEILFETINLGITRYLTKPIRKYELEEALKISLKRILEQSPIPQNLSNHLGYDPINKIINRPQKDSIQLSKKESLLLELYLQNKGKIIPYETIENYVWQGSSMSMDALRTLVRSIRKKTYRELFTNVSSIGYKMNSN